MLRQQLQRPLAELQDAVVHLGKVLVGVQLIDDATLLRMRADRRQRLRPVAEKAAARHRRRDAGVVCGLRDVLVDTRENVGQRYAPVLRVRVGRDLVEPGGRSQADAGLLGGAMHGDIPRSVVERIVDDTCEATAQLLQELPFGGDIGGLVVDPRLHRHPQPPPDLRRLAADQDLAEGLAEMRMRVGEARDDRMAAQGQRRGLIGRRELRGRPGADDPRSFHDEGMIALRAVRGQQQVRLQHEAIALQRRDQVVGHGWLRSIGRCIRLGASREIIWTARSGPARARRSGHRRDSRAARPDRCSHP